MNPNSPSPPARFKGIALFTPGGDLIYCIDPSKQGRWHLHLCVRLQELLVLPEPPHFLIPAYTATVDRWQDPRSAQLQTLAEVYPAVERYQSLLNALFSLGNLTWQLAPWQEETCNPLAIETYKNRFPQLWEDHDLVVRLDLNPPPAPPPPTTPQPYVLRLFISGDRLVAQGILENIHRLLEQGLGHPYTLKVIDITRNPELAETDQVSATPTLVRVWPQPVRRIIGHLDDLPRVLRILTAL